MNLKAFREIWDQSKHEPTEMQQIGHWSLLFDAAFVCIYLLALALSALRFLPPHDRSGDVLISALLLVLGASSIGVIVHYRPKPI